MAFMNAPSLRSSHSINHHISTYTYISLDFIVQIYKTNANVTYSYWEVL
jgi:hypothetical protein